MASNIGGFGLVVTVVGDKTFPIGFPITQFADDADPFDVPSIQIKDKAMGLNGDLISWSKPNALVITLNVIPDSDDDNTLAILFESNRVGKGKLAVTDSITLVGVYPDGKIVSYLNGVLTDGVPGTGVASSGRFKSKNYSFAFENRI